MFLFVLPLALLAILVALALVLAVALARALRTALALERADFQITPQIIRPGEGLRVWARVIPRSERPVRVTATLTCTMFDHRSRRLYAHAQTLTPMYNRAGEFAAFVQMPTYALRSGAVGAELSNLFSEDAHRLLISWEIDFAVTPEDSPRTVLARESIHVEVPEGRQLVAERAFMDELIVETCSAMRSDLVFNWLVQLAAADGHIHPTERQLLHHVLASAHGIGDMETADARVAVEMLRDLQLDPAVLRKHLADDALVAFYRLLYAMAWRDGHLDGREHAFLVAALEKLGLDEPTVRLVEREILHGMAQHGPS